MHFNKLILQILLLRNFVNFLLSLADKVTTGTYDFVILIIKIILLESILLLLFPPAADKTQYFVYLRFNSTLQLMAFRKISKNYLNILMAQQLLHFLEFYYLHHL